MSTQLTLALDLVFTVRMIEGRTTAREKKWHYTGRI
jgi:hypothetical protein